jgi:hypothetical protein
VGGGAAGAALQPRTSGGQGGRGQRGQDIGGGEAEVSGRSCPEAEGEM